MNIQRDDSEFVYSDESDKEFENFLKSCKQN